MFEYYSSTADKEHREHLDPRQNVWCVVIFEKQRTSEDARLISKEYCGNNRNSMKSSFCPPSPSIPSVPNAHHHQTDIMLCIEREGLRTPGFCGLLFLFILQYSVAYIYLWCVIIVGWLVLNF